LIRRKTDHSATGKQISFTKGGVKPSRLFPLFVATAPLIIACQPAASPAGEDSAVTTAAAPASNIGPDNFPPADNRNSDDMIRGCPGMNPDQRPRGSNCHGIFPEQCGADRAAHHIGKLASADLRARITGYAPQGNVRFIAPGEAVTEDLQLGRLNIPLDAKGRIGKPDCY
jgi:hypothetical protein